MYRRLVKGIKKVQNMTTDDFLHNKPRVQKIGKSEKSFEGRNNCGAACFVLYGEYKKKGLPVRVIKNTLFYNKVIYDHVVLQHRSTIIDPTFRQMITPDYNQLHEYCGLDAYHKYIFDYTPIVLYRSKTNVDAMLKRCKDEYWKTYGMKSDKLHIASLLVSLDGQDITDYMDEAIKNRKGRKKSDDVCPAVKTAVG